MASFNQIGIDRKGLQAFCFCLCGSGFYKGPGQTNKGRRICGVDFKSIFNNRCAVCPLIFLYEQVASFYIRINMTGIYTRSVAKLIVCKMKLLQMLCCKACCKNFVGISGLALEKGLLAAGSEISGEAFQAGC